MAGHNGRVKYVTCNREDEIVDLKYRGTTLENFGILQNKTTTGGTLSITDIVNPMLFSGTASGVFAFPVTYTANDFLNDVRKYYPVELYSILTGRIRNTTANTIEIQLPPGCLTVDGFNYVHIGPGEEHHIKYELTSLSPPTWEVTLLENTTHRTLNDDWVDETAPVKLGGSTVLDTVTNTVYSTLSTFRLEAGNWQIARDLVPDELRDIMQIRWVANIENAPDVVYNEAGTLIVDNNNDYRCWYDDSAPSRNSYVQWFMYSVNGTTSRVLYVKVVSGYALFQISMPHPWLVNISYNGPAWNPIDLSAWTSTVLNWQLSVSPENNTHNFMVTRELSITHLPATGTWTELVRDNATLQVMIKSSALKYKDLLPTKDFHTEKIYNINLKTFKYKKDKNNTEQLGIIADDLAKDQDLNYLVNYDENGEILNYNNDKLVIFLLKEIQRLKNQVDLLENKLAYMFIQ